MCEMVGINDDQSRRKAGFLRRPDVCGTVTRNVDAEQLIRFRGADEKQLILREVARANNLEKKRESMEVGETRLLLFVARWCRWLVTPRLRYETWH